ncbi:MAG TPA: hypothetical protein VGS80_11320 [Ktedonobacterales bacterium]|nr:hypothetical protein [Ktedonobacterales bacterium]
MDLATALKVSPNASASRRAEEGELGLIVEIVDGAHYVSLVDHIGHLVACYRCEDYERSRLHEQLADKEQDGWRPLDAIPMPFRRSGYPYGLTLPRAKTVWLRTPSSWDEVP